MSDKNLYVQSVGRAALSGLNPYPEGKADQAAGEIAFFGFPGLSNIKNIIKSMICIF